MGSQVNENGKKTFTAGEALEAFRRVKLSSGSGTQVEYADAGEKGVGTTLDKAASGDMVAVKLWNHPGSRKITLSASASAGDDLKGSNDGKFGGSTGSAICTVLEAGSDDGSIVEALVD